MDLRIAAVPAAPAITVTTADPTRRVLVPRSAVRSKAGRALGWIAFPWVFGFVLVVDAALTAMGWPRGPRPPLLQIGMFLVGAGPAILWVFAGSLGRTRPFAWLLESPQPKLILDSAGLTIATTGGEATRLSWNDIGDVRILPPSVPSRIHAGDGSLLAEIPGPLSTPRVDGGGETRLADELAAFSPRLGAASSGAGRDRLLAGIFLVLLIGLGALGLYILLSR
jgi:hypothetical protein